MDKKITNSKGNKSFFIMSNIMNFISIESLFYVEWHATKRDFIFYCLTSAYQLKETHAFSHWNYSQNLARIFVCAGDARRTIYLVHLAHYVRRAWRSDCFHPYPGFVLYICITIQKECGIQCSLCIVRVSLHSKFGWKGLMTCLTKIIISSWLLNQIGWSFRWDADN